MLVLNGTTDRWRAVTEAEWLQLVNGGAPGGAAPVPGASADNQVLQIALETAIRDRLPATIGPKAAAAALATVAAPFTPTPGSTISHACSTTPLAAVACTPGQVLRFGHTASGPISVAFGASTIAASITAAAALDIYPNCPEALTVPPGVTHWSAVMASGTGTLKCTTGAGG